MKLKKYLFIILLSLITISFINTNSSKASSSDLYLKNLNYDVTLNSDGTAFVTETWDIDIEDTNTLFKTFEIDKTKYSEITNVSLVETTNGINKPFTRIYKEKYHVDKDCFYALINSNGKFEIAWGVHEDDARRTFKISYTIIDAVKNYSDASEFYWQFISKKSEIPARYVTGTITLPSSVTKLGNKAFYRCSELRDINFPSGLLSIGDFVFYGCTRLNSIKVAEGNKCYDSRNDCKELIETETNTLITGCRATIIPDDVEVIGNSAFYHIDGLSSVILGKKLKKDAWHCHLRKKNLRKKLEFRQKV